MRGNRVAPSLAGILAAAVGAGAMAGAATENPPEKSAPAWDFSVSAYGYFVPDDSDYLQPTVTADRGGLHLEGRYNYEDRETGSLWIGYNFGVGEKVAIEITPMVGGVLGNTTGIGPGFHFSLDWRWLELYSEGEYVFDADDRDDSFFYAWSELTGSPSDWLRVGLVGQRTRVHDRPRDIERGILAGVRVGRVEVTAHVFEPGTSSPLYVLSVGVDFGASRRPSPETGSSADGPGS